jgi:GDP-L-fucose synthase
MMRKFHEAKVAGRPHVELWGTGSPRREFLFVDDLADALVHLMEHMSPTQEQTFVNVGVGEDVTIAQLAGTVQKIVGFEGDIEWNTAMPDGTPRKLLDVSRLTELGWSASHSLEQGIEKTYSWYLKNCQI